MSTSEKLEKAFAALKGQPCSHVEILLDGSIKIGLGRRVAEESKGRSIRNGFEYELGSYYRNWMVRDHGVQFDPNAVGVDYAKMAKRVNEAFGGETLLSVEYSEIKRRVLLVFQGKKSVEFDSDIDIDMDDEVFHIRTERFEYIELHSAIGWQFGDSRTPWPQPE